MIDKRQPFPKSFDHLPSQRDSALLDAVDSGRQANTGLTWAYYRFILALGYRVPWKLVVPVMDGADKYSKAMVPLKEAIAYIEAHSQFKFEVEFIETKIAHEYSKFIDEGRDKFIMLAKDIKPGFIESLPVAASYLFLYKLFHLEAFQAGSAMGVSEGILKNGKGRPYSTVPVDSWWYVNNPPPLHPDLPRDTPNFTSWAAQILVHEIINSIQCLLEVAPFNLRFEFPDHKAPWIFEAGRLACITPKYYAMLGKNGG